MLRRYLGEAANPRDDREEDGLEEEDDDNRVWLNAISVFRGDGCTTGRCFDAFVEWLENVLSDEDIPEDENGEDIRDRYEDYVRGGGDHRL